MKKILSIIILTFIVSFSFGQKVKFKKGSIWVDGSEWGLIKTEIFGKKYTFSTLKGDEFVTITYDDIDTGEYDKNGKKITKNYMTVNFLTTDIGTFETGSNTRKQLVRWLVNTEVIVEGELVEENVEKFKNKYQEDISGKYRKGGNTIIINN